MGGYLSQHLLPWSQENRAGYLFYNSRLGIYDMKASRYRRGLLSMAPLVAISRPNSSIATPPVCEDDIHLGLLVGAGLVLHRGPNLLRLRVDRTPLGSLAYNSEVITNLLPEWF